MRITAAGHPRCDSAAMLLAVLVGRPETSTRDLRALRRERGADQVGEFVVADRDGVLRPNPDGRLARLKTGVTAADPGIPVVLPAVDRDAVLPGSEEEPPPADLIRGDVVRQDDRGVRVDRQDQSVQRVDQRPVLGRNGVDVAPNGLVHGSTLAKGARCSLPSARPPSLVPVAGPCEDVAMQLGAVVSMRDDPGSFARHVQRLEDAGVGYLWAGEAYTADAVSTLGFLAAVTKSAQIGSAILPLYTSSPALLAMTALGLDKPSGGPFIPRLRASAPHALTHS